MLELSFSSFNKGEWSSNILGGSLDYAFESPGEGKEFLEGELGSAGIVAPVALLYQRRDPHREVDVALEGKAP